MQYEIAKQRPVVNNLTPPEKFMNAQELLRRYSAGERDFRNAMLCGVDVSQQDLTGANFSGANIRGTKFTQAILHNANFTKVKGGRIRLWHIIAQLLSSLLIVAVALSQFSMWLGLGATAYSIVEGDAFLPIANRFLAWALLGYSLVVAIGLVLIVKRGFTGKILSVCGAVVAVAGILLWVTSWKGIPGENIYSLMWMMSWRDIPVEDVLDLMMKSSYEPASSVVTVVFITIAALAATILAIATISVVIIATELSTVIVAIVLVSPAMLHPIRLMTDLISSDYNYSDGGTVLTLVLTMVVSAILVAAVLALAIPIFASLFVSWQAASGNLEVVFIRNLGLRIKAIGGTSFRGADLTAATFEQAQLAGVNFSPLRQCATKLAPSSLQNARQVNKAFFGRRRLAQQSFNQPEQPYD